MGPTEAFEPDVYVLLDSSSNEVDKVEDNDPVLAEVVKARVIASQEDTVRYYVRPECGRAPMLLRTLYPDTSYSSNDEEGRANGGIHIEGRSTRFKKLLELPRIGPTPKRARKSDEPLIAYSKSII